MSTNGVKHQPVLVPAWALGAFTLMVLTVLVAASAKPARAFTEPTQAPPGGAVSAPLNTSNATQTKSGRLIIQGGLEVQPEIRIGSVGANNALCLNDPGDGSQCITSWTQVVPSNAVTLWSINTPTSLPWITSGTLKNADLGYAAIQARSDQAWALAGQAADPTATTPLSFGVYGLSAPGGTTASYAVYGLARKTNDVAIFGGPAAGVSGHFAGLFSGRTVVFGNFGVNQIAPAAAAVINANGASNAGGANDALGVYGLSATSVLYAEQQGTGFAGYFSGRVSIQGNLEVGAAGQSRQICLNGVCTTTIGGPSASYWGRTAGGVLYPSTAVASDKVAIGSTDANAPFYYDPVAASLILQAPPAGGPPPPPPEIGRAGTKFTSQLGQLFAPQVALASHLSTGSADRLLVKNGVITVDNTAGGASVLELGNAGREIASTGTLFLRPGSLAATQAVQIANVSGASNLYVPGNIGIGQAGPATRLVVNQGASNIGNSNDAVGVYANSLGSAIYAQQDNTGGWSGFYSGKVLMTANGGTWHDPTNHTLIVTNGAGGGYVTALEAILSGANSGEAFRAYNSSTSGYAGRFFGRVLIESNGSAARFEVGTSSAPVNTTMYGILATRLITESNSTGANPHQVASVLDRSASPDCTTACSNHSKTCVAGIAIPSLTACSDAAATMCLCGK